MAGPTASVLFPSRVTDVRRAALRTRLGCGAPGGTYDDFQLEGRPFIVSLGPSSPQEMTEIDLSQLLGWTPEDRVGFAAMCNDAEDHRLLARLSVELAEEAGGIVDFDGALSIGPRIEGVGPAAPMRIQSREASTEFCLRPATRRSGAHSPRHTMATSRSYVPGWLIPDFIWSSRSRAISSRFQIGLDRWRGDTQCSFAH
jgi:hypothetical protein